MKKLKIFILLIVLVFTLASCNNSHNKYNVKQAYEKKELSMSDYRNDEFSLFLDKLNIFSSKLTASLYEEYKLESNFCVSPVSIYMALAMAIECSNTDTRQEILDAVGVTYEEVLEFTSYLYALSNREFYYTSVLNRKKVSAFEQLANSIWIDEKVQLIPEGLESLAKNYHADIYHVQFNSNNRAANKAIADYIYKKTNGLINPDLSLDPETIFTLVNTFYLKEIWNDDGDELPFTTETYDFINYDGKKVNEKLLRGYFVDGKAYETETYTHFYTKTEHNFKIKFIVPKDGYTIDDVFTSDNIETINSLSSYLEVDDERRENNHTRCFFPEFKANYNEDISNVLINKFGILKLFTKDADMSNIAEKAWCTGVIHQTSLDVNKHGIEGAAITLMPMAGAPGPGPYVDVYYDFIVDRSFGFVITDLYDVALFSGVIFKI